MAAKDWKGGKQEERLYSAVRAESQRVIREKYERLRPYLDERARRLWAGSEAVTYGRGGIRAVAEALEISPEVVIAGSRELRGELKGGGTPAPLGRQRRPGGGRKEKAKQEAGLVKAIEEIVDPATRGDPMRPLRWSSKSLEKIREELKRQGWQASQPTISKILRKELKYSLQGQKKTKEGKQHPDRDAQFQYLSRQCKDFQQRGQPVISVDAKKKEKVGEFKNGGREYQPKGKPVLAPSHDFEDKELGKFIPYGAYDPGRNEGWVSVGVDHDTAEFAVSSIRNWWLRMGRKVYPAARELLITADAGGSNGYRVRLWKRELQKLADDTGLTLTICHFPPGTSKWNKIEHRMFCHITANWRGRPLSSLEVAVNLIGATTTKKGLTIQADLDLGTYDKGIEVSDDELARVQLKPADFHGEWNYTITSRNSRS